MKNKKGAFTLIELIVAITILSILWIIAFLNYKDYSRDSRNSVRLNDISNLKKSLELFYLNANFYPEPDNVVNVTYTGGLLWKQGEFWDGMLTKTKNMSKIPLDPLVDARYSYSLFNRSNRYQLWAMVEWKSVVWVIPQTYAYTNEDVNTLVTWNYELFDIMTSTWWNCFSISVPSMFVNNLPVGNDLQSATNYNFAIDEGKILPHSYEGKVEIVSSGVGYTTYPVYNKCEATVLSDINTYIVNLSSAYNQLNALPAFVEVANKSRTLDFIKKSVWFMQANGITVSKNILDSIENAFIDTFSGNNNDILVGWHFADTLWEWEFVWTPTNVWSYVINGNKLHKISGDNDIITPKLLKPKTTADSTTFLNISAFNGGSVTLYARYVDVNNYYAVEFQSTWINIFKYKWWVQTSLSTSSSPISDNSNVQFEVSTNELNPNANNIRIIVNWFEIWWTILDDSNAIMWTWKEIIKLSSSWVEVDDYTLYFN